VGGTGGRAAVPRHWPPVICGCADCDSLHNVGVVERQVLAERVHRLVAPKWVVFEALTERHARRLRLEAAEVAPVVLESTPNETVWSPLWPVSPDDTVEFNLARLGGGTALRFRWLTNSPPDGRGIGITRQRLNQANSWSLSSRADLRPVCG